MQVHITILDVIKIIENVQWRSLWAILRIKTSFNTSSKSVVTIAEKHLVMHTLVYKMDSNAGVAIHLSKTKQFTEKLLKMNVDLSHVEVTRLLKATVEGLGDLLFTLQVVIAFAIVCDEVLKVTY